MVVNALSAEELVDMSRLESMDCDVGQVQIRDMRINYPEPVSHNGETNEFKVCHPPSYLFTSLSI